MNYKEAFDISRKTKKLSRATLSNYTFAEKILTDHFGEEMCYDPIELQLFFNSLSERYAPTTVETYFHTIKAVYRVLDTWYDVRSPFGKIQKPAVPDKERRIFNAEETVRIINACTTDFNRTLVLTLIDSSARIGELACLTADQIDPINGIIKVKGKNFNKKGFIKHRLNPEICQALLSIKPDTTDYVFSTKGIDTPYNSKEHADCTHALSHRVKYTMLRAGMKGEKLGPHTLRHTALSYTAYKTKNALIVKELAGHADLKTSQGYIHAVEKDTTLADNSPLNYIMEDYVQPEPSPDALHFELPIDEKTALIVDPIDYKDNTLTVSHERHNRYESLRASIPILPSNAKEMRPRITAQQYNIIREAILQCAELGTLSVYEGQAIEFLKSMTKKVKTASPDNLVPTDEL